MIKRVKKRKLENNDLPIQIIIFEIFPFLTMDFFLNNILNDIKLVYGYFCWDKTRKPFFLWTSIYLQCHNLESIFDIIPRVEILYLENCLKFTNFYQLKRIKKLCIWYCEDELRVCNVKNLEYLELNNCYENCYISNLANLKSLWLIRCNGIKNGSISNLANLENFQVHNCDGISQIPEFLNLKELCMFNSKIRYIPNLRNIEKITLSKCHYIKNICNLRDLRNLKVIRINDCIGMTRPPLLHGFKCIKLMYNESGVGDCIYIAYKVNECLNKKKYENLFIN